MSEISGLEYIPSILIGLPKKIVISRCSVISQINTNFVVVNTLVQSKIVLLDGDACSLQNI